MGLFSKNKYYSLDKILEKKATYNLIYSGRSDGKTYAVLLHGLKKYIKNGGQMAIVRRWEDDYKRNVATTLFDNIVNNNEISKLTNGEYNGVYYYSYKWYLCKFTEDKNGERIRKNAPEPFAYAFAISGLEHTKSSSYPNVRTIFFDEFITNKLYLPDEPVLFFNLLSTIIRFRDDVEVFMCGNTINKYNPYFEEMGLTHAKTQKIGTIDVYEYASNPELTVAVEYAEKSPETQRSAKYFAFDNPKLRQITAGEWEIDPYPHCPVKFKPKNILFTYFIDFNGDLFQCEIVYIEGLLFTFIHKKTTPLKNEKKDLIFSSEYRPDFNWRRKINKPTDDLGRKIYKFFLDDQVYYQDNVTGDAINNYLKWCQQN